MARWRALLLGGTAASGKSTSARLLARRLGIAYISGDSVWRAVLAITTPETHPRLHEWPRAEVTPREPEPLTKLHIAEAKLLTPALEAFIDREMQEGNRFVFHAAWITPDFAARKCASSGEIKAVFIDEPSREDILASMLERSGRLEPSKRQLVISEVASRYATWLREGAKKRDLPLVPARPRETLVDRIIAAANRSGPDERDQTQRGAVPEARQSPGRRPGGEAEPAEAQGTVRGRLARRPRIV